MGREARPPIDDAGGRVLVLHPGRGVVRHHARPSHLVIVRRVGNV